MMFLPEFDSEYLCEKGFAFEEIEEANEKGLIIRNWELPSGKFNVDTSDLLILIPKGYPDLRPDMWYFNPAIYLDFNTPASKTQETLDFNGEIWQRWSRHFPADEWRSGIDGMHTYLKRVQIALVRAS